MNIKFQRAVDHFLGIPICGFLSLWAKISRFIFSLPKKYKTPQKILIILLSEMGSLVLAQPMFVRLKNQFPNAEIHVMLFAKNREILDLLNVVPFENVITLNDKALFSFAKDSLKAIFYTRKQKFDVVIDCELFTRVSSIFAFLSGAKKQVGFYNHTQEGLYRGSFITHRVLYNPYRHLSLQFLTMVEAINSDSLPRGKMPFSQNGGNHFIEIMPKNPPPLLFTEDELNALKARLYSDFPAIKGKRLILVGPSGGILPIRAWSEESYKTLCKTLIDEGFAVAIIGLPSDKKLGNLLVKHCKSDLCVNLAGFTHTLRELLALFNLGELLITNDGGPGQFAALTPIASIVFFGPETPVLYRALSKNAYSFHLPIACSPCLTAYNHRNSPCDGDNQCLKQITVQMVLAKARELLAHESQNS